MSVEDFMEETVLRITRKQDFDFKPTTTFEDLEADSLDIVQILVALEDHFDIEIIDEELQEVTNMGEMIAYVERKIAEKG